jgi:hypothetical protein
MFGVRGSDSITPSTSDRLSINWLKKTYAQAFFRFIQKDEIQSPDIQPLEG